jgi:DNA topoisomerase VI subunit A
MAKKAARSTRTNDKPVELTVKDKKTLGALRNLADSIVATAERSRPLYLDIPSRSLSNVRYNTSKRFIEMGSGTNRRELFNLSQAKAYMQTVLIGSGCKKLIESGKTTSLRGLFYMLKHTIKGASEETFAVQDESDTIIEDVEVTLNALREELHLYASNVGNLVGPLTLVDSGDEIECTRMGSAGYSIPSIVEPSVIEIKDCKADFILHVEKDTIWRRFAEDKFWLKHNCIVSHGKGQPPRGVRRLLYRLHNELKPGGKPRTKDSDPKLPVYCLLDNDPWGYYIYSVLKQGSINLAFESARMGLPDAKFIGLRSSDYERCQLSPSVQIKLNDQDRKRASQIAAYPWFEKKKEWQKEIQKMLSNGFKLEVEALISKDISYVTEEYVPQRLEEGDFLD